MENELKKRNSSLVESYTCDYVMFYKILVKFHLFPQHMCCFVLLNRYWGIIRSRGFIVSEPRESHPRSEIADVPTSPCPPLDNLGCPDPHPSP